MEEVAATLPPPTQRPSRATAVRGLVALCLVTAAVPAAGQQPAAGGPLPKPWNAILVASFNIQVFGESKMSKPQVVQVLARVVRNFDIVAIQEVRAKSEDILPAFVRAVNADGSHYQHVIGPREGRTSSKEQYAFVYDSNRIEVDPASLGVVPDPQDRMHRPPMHARFRTRINPAAMAFTFWLVNIHTDPDEVPQELDALSGVFQSLQAARTDEDDVILLGDLNAGPAEFNALRRIPGIGWAIAGMPTNTRRSKTYDNLVFARPMTDEYLGHSGVLDLQNAYGLTPEQALEVSDHCPVWAAFHPAEARPQGLPAMAGQPALQR